VWVALKIGANGEVTEAKATRWQLTIDHSIDDPNYWASKPERAFVDAAEATALKWKFAPPEPTRARRSSAVHVSQHSRRCRPQRQPDAANNGGTVIRVGGNINLRKVRDARPAIRLPRSPRSPGGRILDAHIGVGRVCPRRERVALNSHARRRCRRGCPSVAVYTDASQWRAVEVMVTVTVNFTRTPSLSGLERYRW
jgi:hypothetical protein